MLLPNYFKIITFSLTFCSLGVSSYDHEIIAFNATVENQTNSTSASSPSSTGVQVTNDIVMMSQQATGDTNSNSNSNQESTLTASISRRDQLAIAETSPSITHSNHQTNYQVDLYPSATYTTLAGLKSSSSNQQVATAPSPSINATKYVNHNQNLSNLYQSNQQKQINSLLNKDHHSARPFSDAFSEAFINSYSNQAKDSVFNVADNHNYNGNMNFGGSSNSNPNQQLIQNLTASLFPLQFSNSTLSTLGDLLNKTKYGSQSMSSVQATQQQPQINGYKPNFNIETYYTNHLSPVDGSTLPYLSSGSSASNSLTASDFAQSTYGNLLDFLRIPPPSSFRQQSSFKPMHQSTTTPLASQQQQVVNAGGSSNFNNGFYGGLSEKVNPYSKTQSNIYNTYIPAAQLATPMTNGQALNVASLYNQLLDPSSYKLPLQIDSTSSIRSKNHHIHHHQTPQYQTSGSQNHEFQESNTNLGNNNYQFIQHHNSNNQNHLDKVIYHSTPFRPSIVSPPHGGQNGGQSSSLLAGGTKFNGNLNPTQQNQQHSHQQRPKTEADSKSMAFTSMDQYNSNDNNGIGNVQIMTSGQAINASRHRDHGQKLIASTYGHVDFENDHYHSSPSSQSNSSTTTSGGAGGGSVDYNQDSTGKYSNHQLGNKTSSASLSTSSPSGAMSSASGSSTSDSPFGSAPAILFDLYEREIDNQIRDALYRDAQHHALPLLSSLAAQQQQSNQQQQHQVASASSNWFDKIPASHIYEDFDTSSLSPTGSSSGQIVSKLQPPLGGLSADQSAMTTGSYLSSSHSPSSSSSNNRPLVNSIADSGNLPTLDALSAALQELPNFSAADLQPLMPSGPSYSMLPSSASLQDSASSLIKSTAPAASLPSNHLLSHLLDPAFGNIGQQATPASTHQSSGQVSASEMAAALANLASSAALDHSNLLQPLLMSNHHHNHLSSFGSTNSINSNSNHNHQPQAAASSPSSQSSTNVQLNSNSNTNNPPATSGLHGILSKLQSGQLSSILMSPFAHLYAGSSKYRHGKHKHRDSHNQQQQQQQSQPSGHNQIAQASAAAVASTQQQLPSNLNYFLSPESLFATTTGSGVPATTTATTSSSSSSSLAGAPGVTTNGHAKKTHSNHLFSLMGQTTGGTSMLDPSYYQLGSKYRSNLAPSYQQQQQVSPTLENLLASSPYSHLGSGSLLEPDSLASYFNHQTIQQQPAGATTPTSWDGSGFFGTYGGFTGAGLKPLIYRNVISPWARKQAASSGASAAASSITSGNLSPLFSSLLTHGPQTVSASTNNHSLLARPSLSSLLGVTGSSLTGGNGGGFLSSLFNPSMLASASLASNTATGNVGTNVGRNSFATMTSVGPKPRIKIKILRIPVAVYDQSGTSTGELGGTGSVSMMPSQMQPSLTASLLAGMPCPMTHSQTSYVPPHQFDQHLAAISSSSGINIQGLNTLPLTTQSQNESNTLYGSSYNLLNANGSGGNLTSSSSDQLQAQPLNQGQNQIQIQQQSSPTKQSTTATSPLSGITDLNQPEDL